MRRYLWLDAPPKEFQVAQSEGSLYTKSREFFPFIVMVAPFSLTVYYSNPFCRCFPPPVASFFQKLEYLDHELALPLFTYVWTHEKERP
jgi:hypothetical protein